MADLRQLRRLMRQLEDQLVVCMRCGMCQAVCPVFAQTGREADVARGKLVLLDGLLQEMLNDPEAVRQRLQRCLLCGSCAANCPSGVNVLDIFLKARAILAGYLGLPPLKKAVFRRLLAHPRTMDRVVEFGAVFQKLFTRPVNEIVGTSCARFAFALAGRPAFSNPGGCAAPPPVPLPEHPGRSIGTQGRVLRRLSDRQDLPERGRSRSDVFWTITGSVCLCRRPGLLRNPGDFLRGYPDVQRLGALPPGHDSSPSTSTSSSPAAPPAPPRSRRSGHPCASEDLAARAHSAGRRDHGYFPVPGAAGESGCGAGPLRERPDRHLSRFLPPEEVPGGIRRAPGADPGQSRLHSQGNAGGRRLLRDGRELQPGALWACPPGSGD